MAEPERKWNNFRLEGGPPTGNGKCFSIEFHHGGRFYRMPDGKREYRGGEVVWLDNQDEDKLSWPCLNGYAEDLGYRDPPLVHWFKLPGSRGSAGFLPIRNDKEVVDMLAFLVMTRCLEIYIVCGAARKLEEVEFELKNNIKPKYVNSVKYMGNVVEDLVDMGEDAMNELAIVDMGQFNVIGSNHRPRKEKLKGKRVVQKCSAATNGDSPDNASERMKEKIGRTKKQPRKGKRYETRPKGDVNYLIEEDEMSDSDDPDFEQLIDSDYELVQVDDIDDDVMFKGNVDGDTEKVNEWALMGFEGTISDGEGEDSSEFESVSESGDSETNDELLTRGERKKRRRFNKFKAFRRQKQMREPTFEIGMSFANTEAFKDAVRLLAVTTRKELRFPTNDKKRVLVTCTTSPGCPFRMWASINDKNSSNVYLKTMKMEHACNPIKGKVYHCNAPFIAKGYLDNFMKDREWSRDGVQCAVDRDFGMEIGYQMCYRAKKRARNLGQGTIEDQYNLLETYASVIKKANENTTVYIDGDLLENGARRFKRMYICYGALKKGWMEGCRPVIGLDGCHLKTSYKGQLLTAVGIDANNGMYPVAFAVVEKETKESWIWFLTSLKDDLELENDSRYVFISDKQKGILDAVKLLLPNSCHRHCARHLYNNLKNDGNPGQELKDIFWAAARSTTKQWYKKNMDKMHNKSTKAWNFFTGVDKGPEHWSRAYFSNHTKCDILLNNHCESFNSTILAARKMPILGLLEDLRMNLLIRCANRRCAGERWKANVGPRIEKFLEKYADMSHDYTSFESSHLRFQVRGKGASCASGVVSLHDVNLATGTCTCERWDRNGLPCAHAIACIFSKGYNPVDFVHEYYSKKRYMDTYTPAINPIPGVDEWEIIDKPILPPLYKRGAGRPKMSRNKEPGEAPPPAGCTKLAKSYYSKVTCSLCGEEGHNKRSKRHQHSNASQATEGPSTSQQPTQEVLHEPSVVPQEPTNDVVDNEMESATTNALTQPSIASMHNHEVVAVSSSQPTGGRGAQGLRGRGSTTVNKASNSVPKIWRP